MKAMWGVVVAAAVVMSWATTSSGIPAGSERSENV